MKTKAGWTLPSKLNALIATTNSKGVDVINDLQNKLRQIGPGLLNPDWRKRWTPERPTTGFCYLISEIVYHYFAHDHVSMCINLPGIGTHWFLQGPNGSIVDLTADQFDFPVPYDKGTKKIFFTGKIPTTRGTISWRAYRLAKALGIEC